MASPVGMKISSIKINTHSKAAVASKAGHLGRKCLVPTMLISDRKIISSRPDHELPDNLIRTCKYTLLTFLPLNLME